MFTVCPKCALTLVVTAADLRVAQGYVRCGRCSNVFNALARLSEDRQAASAAAQAQASPEAASPAQQRADSSASHRMRVTQDPGASAATRKPHDPGATASTRKLQDVSTSAKLKQVPEPVHRPAQPVSPPAGPKRYDDNSIPEEDLEFNPDGTDLNKVFVEQPPTPQFTAATGTFKAIRMEAENAARAAESDNSAHPALSTDEHESSSAEPFDPTDTQVDVEIDPDLLASMAQLTAKPAAQAEADTHSARPESPPGRVEGKSAPPAKPPSSAKPGFQPPLEPQAPMRLADRAKARAERATALETTQAIHAALAPRKRTPLSNLTTAAGVEPTSFFAGMWMAGSVLLVLLLVIQLVHHYRHDLATSPTLNGPLTAIYAVLGVPIVPRWDLDSYEVRQLGASTSSEAPGQITVRASVKNAAHQAQPLPLLRVTLQDRFGNRIASSDVPPQSYLPRAIPSSSLLSAGQRIDAEMTFVDPGSNAVGFEIDACLLAPGGGITCANDGR